MPLHDLFTAALRAGDRRAGAGAEGVCAMSGVLMAGPFGYRFRAEPSQPFHDS
jgi:hypothetical protein